MYVIDCEENWELYGMLLEFGGGFLYFWVFVFILLLYVVEYEV